MVLIKLKLLNYIELLNIRNRKLTLKKKIISNNKLKNRISLNKRFQKFDFVSWQKKKYSIIIKKFNLYKSNLNILDLGCGTGIQVKLFLKLLKKPQIFAIDLSKESLIEAKKNINSTRVKYLNNDIDHFFKKSTPKFDLIHSSYAFYYSRNPEKLVQKCFEKLNKGGCMIIACPDKKHEMIELVGKIGSVKKSILETLNLYDKTLFKFSKENRRRIKKIFYKKINNISFKNFHDFLQFWKNTTYYDEKIIKKIEKNFENGKKSFQKGTIIFAIKKL